MCPERDCNEANRTSGNRWRKDKLRILKQVIKTEATQLEIAAVLPRRSREAIRKKIAQVHGKVVIVPETGSLEPSEKILDYLESHPDTAAAMSFAILENCLRQLPQNMNYHCSGVSVARFYVSARSTYILPRY